jgi:hypothetical protein
MLPFESKKSLVHAMKKMTENSIVESPLLDDLRESVEMEEKMMEGSDKEMGDFEKEMLRVLMSNMGESSKPLDFSRDFMRFIEENAEEIDRRMEKEERERKKQYQDHRRRNDGPDFYS